MLTTVAAFREPWEAHMFCSRLEAEGVPAFVVHEYHIWNAWHYSTALGGVKVQVGEELKDEAKSIERRCSDGEFLALLESEFGNTDDTCPNCGSNDYSIRRSFLRIILVTTLLFPLGIIAPPKGWICFCNRCGTKFKQPSLRETLRRCAIVLTGIVADLVIFLGLALCLWALSTGHWLAVLVIATVLAGRLVTRGLSASDTNHRHDG